MKIKEKTLEKMQILNEKFHFLARGGENKNYYIQCYNWELEKRVSKKLEKFSIT